MKTNFLGPNLYQAKNKQTTTTKTGTKFMSRKQQQKLFLEESSSKGVN